MACRTSAPPAPEVELGRELGAAEAGGAAPAVAVRLARPGILPRELTDATLRHATAKRQQTRRGKKGTGRVKKSGVRRGVTGCGLKLGAVG